MYLHKAIRKVLEDNGGQPMTIQRIASAINQQRLCTKRDGSAIGPHNVGLRAMNDALKGTDLDALVGIREE